MAKKKKEEKAVEKKTSTKAKPKAKPKKEEVQYYVVKHYLETLGEVARMFDTTPEKIMEDNHMKNNRIHQGQTLMIKK